MKLTQRIFTLILAAIAFAGSSQNCPNLGPNLTLPCGVTTTVLTANMTACNPTTITPNQTNTYSVTNIPFAPYANAGTAVALTDDSQTGVLPIGFTFCFFGNTYTQFYIGSNGWIAFTAGQPVTFASSAIPNGGGGIPKNCIMGPWQDWHPGVGGTIRYQTQGTAPCRRLVVTWANMPMYSCTNLQGTFQIVIFEGTNLIENHITNKPNCPAWSGGTAVQGIHNLAGTIGITVPGRNSTQWTTTNNAYRWSPSGAAVIPTLTWFAVGNPVPIGTGPTCTVTPPTGGQLYTCHNVYPACYAGFDGCIPSFGNSPDTVLVVPGLTGITPTITAPFCINGPTQISVAPNSATNIVQWTGPTIVGASNSPTVTVNGTGIYSVVISNAVNTCTGTATVSVQQTPTVVIGNNGPVCTGTVLNLTGGGVGTYAWTGPNAFNSAVQNPVINPVTVGASGVYSLVVTANTCTSIATTNVLVNPLPVPIANSNSPVCVNQPINFTGSGASTYTWTGPGSYSSTAQNPIIASAQATNGGVYTLSVTSAAGCKNNVTTNVVVNPLPVIVTNSPVACLNTNINLTATGGTSYSWSGPLGFTSLLQNPSIANATLPMTGVYTVTVTTASGCTATATSSVTVVSLPVPVLNSNSPVCLNGALTFTASGGAINLTGPNGFFAASSNPAINPVSALANGIYTLIVSAGTCTASTTTSVTINPLPVPLAGSNSPVCVGQPLNLTGNGGVSYAWSGPGLYTSNAQNPTIAVAQSTNGGVYTLTVTNANTCTNVATTNVVINPLPVIATLNNPTVCLNTSINLTANGGTGYVWAGPLGFTSALQNPTIANATIPMSGPYSVTVTSVFGCTNSAIATVAVLPLPLPVIIANTPCVGSSLNLIGSGGAQYAWSGPNGFNTVIQNPVVQNITLAANGIYTLITTVGTCTASTTQSVTVNPLPTPAAGNNAPICETKLLNLTGNGGGNYSWAGPNGFTSAVQNPSITGAIPVQSGTYILTVTDANGCQATASTVVNVLPNPSALATGATVCYGQPATISATGGATYSWTGPNGFTSNISNPTIPAANNLTSGNYVVMVTGVNTCTSITAANVIANPLPVPSITATAKTCLNTQVNLQGSTGFQLSQWTGPNNFISPNSSTSFTATSITESGVYFFSITDNNGCTGSIGTNVIIDPLPIGTLVSDGKSSCVPFCSNFTLSTAPGSASIASASWLINGSGYSGNVINYCCTQPGKYFIKANFVDANGCPNNATYTISAYPIPVANFEFSPLNPVENTDPVLFDDVTNADSLTSWNWFFINNNNYQSTSQNPSYFFPEAGTYPVAMIVKNKWGCSDTVVKSVVVGEDYSFFIPNSFTPNGDGINDTFYPKGHGIVKYDMVILDRWGEKIFSTTDFFQAWDGTFKGAECKEDVYVWKVNVTLLNAKVKTYTGHVTLNK